MANDIARLRQQQLLGMNIPDMSGGTMGMGMGMNYSSPSPMGPPPIMPDWGTPSTAQGIPGLRAQQNDWQGPLQPPEVGQSNQPTTIDDLMAQVNRFYTPSTQASERFNTLLDQYPQREEPSFARKLVAGGIGLDARQRLGTQYAPLAARADPTAAMEKVLYAPYIRDVADWSAKATPFSQAAQLENTSNVNERNLVKDVFTTKYNQDRLERTSQIADERNRIQEEKNKASNQVSQLRAMTDRMKAMGYKFDTSGVTVIATRTGPDGKPEVIDTGVKTGDLSKTDEINLRGEWNVETARQRGADAATTANIRSSRLYVDDNNTEFKYDAATGRFEASDGSGRQPQGNLRIPGTVSQNTPPRGATGPQGTLEQRRIEQDRARDARELDPIVRKWTTVGSNGLIQMKPRPVITPENTWWPGTQAVTQAEVDEWDAAKKALDPSYVPPNPKTTPEKPGIGPSNQPAPPAPTQSYQEDVAEINAGRRVWVLNKNGKVVGTVPNTPEELESMRRQGFTTRKY